jgi:hypothetical protein
MNTTNHGAAIVRRVPAIRYVVLCFLGRQRNLFHLVRWTHIAVRAHLSVGKKGKGRV